MKVRHLCSASIVLLLWCGTEARASSFTLMASGQARASQIGVLDNHRDPLGHGGWDIIWTSSPNGVASGEASLAFPLSSIPDGSVITSAVLNWQFTNPYAQTGSSYGQNLPGLPGHPGARIPQCTSSYCRFASINYWAPGEAYRASRLELNGGDDYWFPASAGNPTGRVDLLSIYPSSALVGSTLDLIGLVQYWLGRPFFGQESRGADTPFDVSGFARVDLSAWLTVSFSPPPTLAATSDLDPVATPEPASLTFVGSGLLLLARIAKRRSK